MTAGTISSRCCWSPMQFDDTQFDDTKSGDHIVRGPDNQEAVVSNIPERQAVSGQNVRYVLLVGIYALVIVFALYLALLLR